MKKLAANGIMRWLILRIIRRLLKRNYQIDIVPPVV
jgi:hypothetical protein